MRVLFHAQAVDKDGVMRDVDVYIDNDHCLKVAARAARNTTGKSKSGPVHARVVKSKI